ncbi:DUF1499 domain-containing protein [Albibacillus kandeliae]|uniref:DUF1499 domain-containing protein n=1 Tax=Albibacillus kandeliae TaxID=2174228 RepID=UPI000D69E4A2|nr:DUF1499 domain-containing protein [Albibacillus kandeliae]
MKTALMFLWIVICLCVVAVGYVRLAPSPAADWHLPLEFESDRDMKGGVERVVETGPDGLARLDAVARATPRTEVLAGSVAEGRVTYVTRTKWIGFPDYTTAEQHDDVLRVWGRLRFGRSDFGVNKARVDRWLADLQP